MNREPVASFDIEERAIGPGAPIFVIAEIGVNHEGSLERCAEMIVAAVRAGADAIKLQTIDPAENYVLGTESHRLFSTAQLSREDTARAFAVAREHGVLPFTTAGDGPTLEWVDRLEPVAYKISSGLLTNLPVIRLAARTGRALVMSTGMATVTDIDEAVAAARYAGARAMTVLQCTSLYPAPEASLNLNAIGWLERRYGVPAGYSDHAPGDEAAVLSVAAGARVIEKHFTFDPDRPGYDHALSLDAAGFARMVSRVRAAERMMGRTGKHLSAAERNKAGQMHRILVARRPITPGEEITPENLALKRPLPGTEGLAPKFYDQVLGRRAARALAVDDPVSGDALEGGL